MIKIDLTLIRSAELDARHSSLEVVTPVTPLHHFWIFDQDTLRGQALPGNTAIEFFVTDGSYLSWLFQPQGDIARQKDSFM